MKINSRDGYIPWKLKHLKMVYDMEDTDELITQFLSDIEEAMENLAAIERAEPEKARKICKMLMTGLRFGDLNKVKIEKEN